MCRQIGDEYVGHLTAEDGEPQVVTRRRRCIPKRGGAAGFVGPVFDGGGGGHGNDTALLRQGRLLGHHRPQVYNK